MAVLPPNSSSNGPTIRCSTCGFEIGLDALADHRCSQPSRDDQHTPEVIPLRAPPTPTTRDAPSRPSRRPMQLPKIDPYAANRPGQYYHSGELTPASSGHSSQLVSPRSDSSSSIKLPWPMPPPPSRKMSTPVVRGPPSPELISQDCAFPAFPTMSKVRSNTPNSDSDGDAFRKPSYPKSNLSSPRGSIHTENTNSSKPRSRRASTASTKSTSKGRSRAKTIETKSEVPATPTVPPPNMKRRPSLSNFFGIRKTPQEKMPPLPTTTPILPISRKGSKDDQPPIQAVQSAPAGPSPAPMGTSGVVDELEQLQRFDFQVSAPTKLTQETEPTPNPYFPATTLARASVASSIYPDSEPLQPEFRITPETPVEEEVPVVDPAPKEIFTHEPKEILTRLDGPGESSGKEPSYKAKRPAPIDSNLTIDTTTTKLLSPSRSPTFPLHNTDRQTGNGPNGIMGRRPSDSSSTLSPSALSPTRPFPLSPIRTGAWPLNSIGNLTSPRPVRTPTSAVPSTPASFQTAPTQPPTSGSTPNLNRVSVDSASSYGSEPSLDHSMSSQSSPPRDEPRRDLMDSTREAQMAVSDASDLPRPLRPLLPRMQTDSPTDPLFQNGLLSSIPASPSVMSDPSPGLASNGFNFHLESPPISTDPSAGSKNGGFDFGPRKLSNTVDEHAKHSAPQHAPKRSQTTSANKGTCRGCQKIIGAKQKSVSSADGRLTGKYHKECFACHSCKSPFATADFYVLQDLPYCAQHYHEQNGTLCVGCGKGIEGQYLESSNNKSTASRKFHAHCLACTTCHCQLRDDYFEFNGRIYCERDAFRAASPHTSRSQYDTAPAKPSPLSQGMLRADSEAGARKFPERRTTKLMSIGGNGELNII